MLRIMQIALAATLLSGMILVALGCDALPSTEAVPPETPVAPAPVAPAPITQEETMTTPQKPSDETPPVAEKASATPPAEEKTPATPAASNAPVLAGDLKRGCQRGRDLSGGLAVGTLAVDFTLDDTTGQSHTLSEMLARQPVVMVFGSFT